MYVLNELERYRSTRAWYCTESEGIRRAVEKVGIEPNAEATTGRKRSTLAANKNKECFARRYRNGSRDGTTVTTRATGSIT